MSVLEYVRLQWDRVLAWVCIALGAVAVALGWFGMSGTPYPAEQLPYILSGGVAGIFLVGLGAMLWLSADLRDEWRKLDELEGSLGIQQEAQSFGTHSRPVSVVPAEISLDESDLTAQGDSVR